MSLSREEVLHIATLCRLGMTEEDLETLPQQLSQILEMFRTLGELDTEGLPPTAQAASLETVMRDDHPRPSLPSSEVLSNAPRRRGDLFQVNVVLEE